MKFPFRSRLVGPQIMAPLFMAADLTNFVDAPEEGGAMTADELPSQGGSRTPTILPGTSTFRLPANIDQCWEPFDFEKKIGGVVQTHPAGTVIGGVDVSGQAVIEHHLMLKFDSENPLIVEGGPYDGLPVNYVSISTMPRKRGKGDDAPSVPDMTYFVRKCLKDASPVQKRSDWMAIVNKHAGAIIRLEHGLSAFCDPERVRYIGDGAGGVIEDPDGNHGCGKGPAGKERARFYTSAFHVDEVDGDGNKTGRKVYTDAVTCPNCGAALRGFFRVEKFLEPLASGQQVGGGAPAAGVGSV